MNYLSKKIGSEVVLWFQESNKYLVFETLFYEVFKIIDTLSILQAKSRLTEDMGFNDLQVTDSFDAYVAIEKQLSITEKSTTKLPALRPPVKWQSTHYYNVYNCVFKIRYSSSFSMELVHPKFAHLKSEKHSHFALEVDVVQLDSSIALYINNKHVNTWSIKDASLLQGKFAMELLNTVHSKSASNWMAVLHASAVYKKDKTVLFLGESGSGKSTATALSILNGYHLLADDFVPLESNSHLLYSFPAAISIKEPMLVKMEKVFPSLKNSLLRVKNEQVNYKYLYPINDSNLPQRKPANALIFIQYTVGATTSLNRLSTKQTLELLVPDSWISANEKQVCSFLDWIAKIPSYSLEYSDDVELINIVNDL